MYLLAELCSYLSAWRGGIILCSGTTRTVGCNGSSAVYGLTAHLYYDVHNTSTTRNTSQVISPSQHEMITQELSTCSTDDRYVYFLLVSTTSERMPRSGRPGFINHSHRVSTYHTPNTLLYLDIQARAHSLEIPQFPHCALVCCRPPGTWVRGMYWRRSRKSAQILTTSLVNRTKGRPLVA